MAGEVPSLTLRQRISSTIRIDRRVSLRILGMSTYKVQFCGGQSLNEDGAVRIPLGFMFVITSIIHVRLERLVGVSPDDINPSFVCKLFIANHNISEYATAGLLFTSPKCWYSSWECHHVFPRVNRLVVSPELFAERCRRCLFFAMDILSFSEAAYRVPLWNELIPDRPPWRSRYGALSSPRP